MRTCWLGLRREVLADGRVGGGLASSLLLCWHAGWRPARVFTTRAGDGGGWNTGPSTLCQ